MYSRAFQQRPIIRYSVISFSIRSADSLIDYSGNNGILKSIGMDSPSVQLRFKFVPEKLPLGEGCCTYISLFVLKLS